MHSKARAHIQMIDGWIGVGLLTVRKDECMEVGWMDWWVCKWMAGMTETSEGMSGW